MAEEHVPYNGPVVTRSEAKAIGSLRYFTSKACLHGHVAQRWTTTGGCCECVRISLTKRRRAAGVLPRPAVMPVEIFRQKRNALNRKWKSKNRHKLAFQARAYYADNRDVINEKNKARAKANPVETLCRSRSAKRRRNGAAGKHTKKDIDHLFVSQKSKCAACFVGISAGYHVDHIVPLNKGGTHWPSNLQLLCQSCNRRKSDLDPFEWAWRNGRLL